MEHLKWASSDGVGEERRWEMGIRAKETHS